VNPKKFFGELKRRNVYRVAAAYAVIAWLFIQIATQVFPFFEIPNPAVRLVVLLLVIGFPVALILAWAFELTPEGIKRTEEVGTHESIRHRTGRKIVAITMTLAVVAAGLLAFQLSRQEPAGRAASPVVAKAPSVDTVGLKAAILQADGNLPGASSLLVPLRPAIDDPFLTEIQVYQAILERNPEQIIAWLKQMLAKPDPMLGFYNSELRFWLSWVQEVGGDNLAAKATWLQARGELEPFLQTQPENFALIQDLALINMGLGDKAAAFALADRAKEVNPTEKDSMYGPFSTEVIARIQAPLGEPSRAIAALQELVSVPYRGPLVWIRTITPALLQLDPMFDPLRSDLHFQKLVATKVVATPENSRR
jgi:hypothetical protein